MERKLLVVNEKVVSMGKVLNTAEIKKLLHNVLPQNIRTAQKRPLYRIMKF